MLGLEPVLRNRAVAGGVDLARRQRTVVQAKLVDLTASPNPATIGNQVRHTVNLGAPTRLELYVSAAGFERPGIGTLPAGSWTYRCCPAQTAGTPAWY